MFLLESLVLKPRGSTSSRHKEQSTLRSVIAHSQRVLIDMGGGHGIVTGQPEAFFRTPTALR